MLHPLRRSLRAQRVISSPHVSSANRMGAGQVSAGSKQVDLGQMHRDSAGCWRPLKTAGGHSCGGGLPWAVTAAGLCLQPPARVALPTCTCTQAASGICTKIINAGHAMSTCTETIIAV